MAKVTLGTRPETFEPTTVTCALPEGGTGEIGITFKYRTRQQYAEFADAIHRAANMKPAVLPDAAVLGEDAAKKAVEEFQFSLAEAVRKGIKNNADFILDAVSAWDLDHDLSRKSIEQLCDELPGAAFAIVEKYRTMCAEGRLGN